MKRLVLPLVYLLLLMFLQVGILSATLPVTTPVVPKKSDSADPSSWKDKLLKILKLDKPKEFVIICGFDDSHEDLSWETGGYVSLSASDQHVSAGRYSCKATFSIPSDFISPQSHKQTMLLTPIRTESLNVSKSAVTVPAGVTKSAQSIGTRTVMTRGWQPAMSLGWETLTRLPFHDWKNYKTLRMTIFNPQKRSMKLTVRILDGRSYEHSYVVMLAGDKENLVSMDLGLAVGQRVDITNIKSLGISIDTTEESAPIVLFIDDIKLTKN